MLVRYGDSANAKNMSNQIHGENQEEELRKNLDKYPCKLSVGKIRQTFISILNNINQYINETTEAIFAVIL